MLPIVTNKDYIFWSHHSITPEIKLKSTSTPKGTSNYYSKLQGKINLFSWKPSEQQENYCYVQDKFLA